MKKQQKLLKKLEDKDTQGSEATGGVSSSLQIIKKGGSQDSAPSKSKTAGKKVPAKKAAKGSQEDASMQENISQEDAEAV